MTRWSPALLAAVLLAGCAAPSTGPGPCAPVRLERPIPYPATPPADYQRAVAAGTRTPTGAPGARYWQNRADYAIRARVIPDRKRLEGSETITYTNNSPNALNNLQVDLTLNHHAPGVVRNEPAEITGGVEVTRVALGGQALTQGGGGGPRYAVNGTRMVVVPAAPVQPGEHGADRHRLSPTRCRRRAPAGGWDGASDDLFFFAYWYPAMAVYDDVVGWHPDPFRGTAEFYADFGSYDVTVEAPAQWIVFGTGTLQNPEQALAPAVLQRYRQGIASDQVVNVVTPADFGRVTTAGRGGMVTWRFRADSVRDHAVQRDRAPATGTRRAPPWATATATGARTTRAIHAFWRPGAPRWANVARFEAHAITFLSEYTGMPYPWPHMTAVEGEGIIGGGMEYPMMTLISAYTQGGDSALYTVTAHELAHMWVPMIVSVDERRYSWMDEGMTTFHEAQARKDTFPGSTPELEDRDGVPEPGPRRRRGRDHAPQRLPLHRRRRTASPRIPSRPPTSSPCAALLGDGDVQPRVAHVPAALGVEAPLPVGLLQHGGGGERAGPGLVLAHLVLRDVDAGPGRHQRGGGPRRRHHRRGGPRPGAHARAADHHARETATAQGLEVPVETWLEGRRTATVTLPGRRVAHHPGGDRRGERVPRRRPRQQRLDASLIHPTTCGPHGNIPAGRSVFRGLAGAGLRVSGLSLVRTFARVCKEVSSRIIVPAAAPLLAAALAACSGAPAARPAATPAPAADRSLAAPASAPAQAAVPVPGPANTEAAITAADLRERLEIVAHDSMQGREVGTPGMARATSYLVRELQRLGLRPAGDDGTYLDRVDLVRTHGALRRHA